MSDPINEPSPEDREPNAQQERVAMGLALSFGACGVGALVAWGLPWIFVDRPFYEVSSLLLVLGGLYFGYLKQIPEGSGPVWFRRPAGLVFLLAGLLMPWEGGPEANMSWEPYDERRVVAAKEKGKPVMIDFTAAWCGPCHVMDAQVFGRKKVVAAADRFVRLKADMTDSGDPRVQELAQQYSIVAYPTVVLIGSDGIEMSRLRLVGLEWADEFEQRLAAVR